MTFKTLANLEWGRNQLTPGQQVSNRIVTCPSHPVNQSLYLLLFETSSLVNYFIVTLKKNENYCSKFIAGALFFALSLIIPYQNFPWFTLDNWL